MSTITTELLGGHVKLSEISLDADEAQRALGLVRDGVIGGYEARRHFRLADGSVRDADVWIQSLQGKKPKWALVVISFREQVANARRAPDQALVAGPLVSGTADRRCRIDCVSSDASRLTGRAVSELIGERLETLVHPGDRERATKAAKYALAELVGVCVHLRLASRDDWWLGHVLLVPVGQGREKRLAFVTFPDPEPLGSSDRLRLQEVEQRLWRIALEVQAAGLTLRSSALQHGWKIPQLSELSSRQWQIIERLTNGERVPDIARAMYLSQSTIRNHLSAIFRKFGVHSQSALIAKIKAMQSGNSSS